MYWLETQRYRICVIISMVFKRRNNLHDIEFVKINPDILVTRPMPIQNDNLRPRPQLLRRKICKTSVLRKSVAQLAPVIYSKIPDRIK